MHLIEREGFRAGTRSTAGVSWTDPWVIGMSLSGPSERRGVVDCALVGAVVERYEDGEARVVGGVSWVCERLMAPWAPGRVGALKPDELALV
jgi:hypothetical protein